MAFPAFFSVKGARQGPFKGEAKEAGRENWMPVRYFTMELESPRDPASGQATGKRQWKPVKVVKEWGAASPQGLTACATNEVLQEVNFQFLRTNPSGQEYVYQTVKLTNATISDVVRFTGGPEALAAGGKSASWDASGELEAWSFTFQQVDVFDADGNTEFLDDWVRTT
ncbi:MAG TPA: type VI secretion system tube protein TssD [Stellaceae bacterium]|nr:type VI secretion system tube protein TssD [Stellaceae bacterium]